MSRLLTTGGTRQAEREAKVLETVGGPAAPHLYDFSMTSAWFDTPSMSMALVPGRQSPLDDATPMQIEQLGGVVADVRGRALVAEGGGWILALVRAE